MQEENTMKLGFIGCGNMAGAMMGGIIKNNIFKASRVISWQKSSKKQDCKKMHEQLESPTLWRNERRKTAAHFIFVLS